MLCTPLRSGLDTQIGRSSFSWTRALVGSRLEFLGWIRRGRPVHLFVKRGDQALQLPLLYPRKEEVRET